MRAPARDRVRRNLRHYVTGVNGRKPAWDHSERNVLEFCDGNERVGDLPTAPRRALGYVTDPSCLSPWPRVRRAVREYDPELLLCIRTHCARRAQSFARPLASAVVVL